MTGQSGNVIFAGVAHPVERHLAKVEVASSSLVARSIFSVLQNRSSYSERDSPDPTNSKRSFGFERREAGVDAELFAGWRSPSAEREAERASPDDGAIAKW